MIRSFAISAASFAFTAILILASSAPTAHAIVA